MTRLRIAQIVVLYIVTLGPAAVGAFQDTQSDVVTRVSNALIVGWVGFLLAVSLVSLDGDKVNINEAGQGDDRLLVVTRDGLEVLRVRASSVRGTRTSARLKRRPMGSKRPVSTFWILTTAGAFKIKDDVSDRDRKTWTQRIASLTPTACAAGGHA